MSRNLFKLAGKMKLAMKKGVQEKTNLKRAVIQFERPPARTLEKGQYHVYKLRTVPTDPNSPIYKLTVHSLIMVPQKSGLRFGEA